MVKTLRVSALAAALAGLSLGGVVFASDNPASENSQGANPLGANVYKPSDLPAALLEQASDISRQGRAGARALTERGELEWVQGLSRNTVVQAAQARREALDLPARDTAPAERPHPLDEGFRTLVFVSWSLGEAAIEDILRRYDGQPGVGVVFRGIPDGLRMVDAMTRMHRLTQATESQVPVLLDPLAFRRHGIQLVPAVVIERSDESLAAKVVGIDSVTYVEEAMREGRAGDLGTLGTPRDILEPDLMEVAKARIEGLDFAVMKQRALDRFWHAHTGHALPTATVNATRRVDPSVVIPQDILDAQGKVVAQAGRINPLHLRPFDQKLVVIDPTQPWQVALAQRERADHGRGLTVTVMATQIPPDAGWPLFERTQQAIDAPLYLLPGDLARRFQIQKTPSVVTAEGEVFVVREFARESVQAKEVRDVQE
ncbi:conjugal transfer protein [Azotobacter chroococcum]|uniref:TrbC family F-type conjugative pilus assembly protein n=1 Tax=Azotobacter chroococcum TaxID=353 RepID=UPI001040B20A|nr:TrbC family F-type conjugative pilus assembly protein [Azotobacter chroococcum]TBW36205.1 conjugal transfer protein [Azotobacter chroococcum]